MAVVPFKELSPEFREKLREAQRYTEQKILNGYQWDFLCSSVRYPGMVAAWASGKTLCGILRGCILSEAYVGNLGLIVRKTYKDLADSTLSDFKRYTGIEVPSSTRDATFKATKSKVMFRHLEELTGGPTGKLIQNINLGWFYIEQAEEFDTAEQFEMLRGRLRRELKQNAAYFDYKRKQLEMQATAKRCFVCKTGTLEEEGGVVLCTNCHHIWMREPDPRHTAFLDFLEHNELRTGFPIANANGKNWVWRQWVSPNRPNADEFVGFQATTFDNEHNLKPDFIKDLRSMEKGTETQRRKFRRYVMNLHDEADIEGAYYLALMQEARADGRIGSYKPDRSTATHTVWDLGINDTTAIWFFQKIGREVRHIHYYENNGEGIEHYIRYLDSVRDRLKLHYGQHFWPVDGKKKDLSTGKELRKTAQEMGLTVTILPQEKKVVGGIERTRKMLPYATFDENECSVGIEVLEHYQRKKNHALSTEEKTVYGDTPLHDWASNGADCERYMSMADRKLGGGSMTKERVQELMEMFR